MGGALPGRVAVAVLSQSAEVVMRVFVRAGLVTSVASALVKSARKLAVRGGASRSFQRPIARVLVVCSLLIA